MFARCVLRLLADSPLSTGPFVNQLSVITCAVLTPEMEISKCTNFWFDFEMLIQKWKFHLKSLIRFS